MYAPFGAGMLISPRRVLAAGDPFLAGGGAGSVLDLDDVAWVAPPEREEAGSPNVIGAVALRAAIGALEAIGWPAVVSYEGRIARLLRGGLAAIPGVRLLGPGSGTETLPIATFTVEGVPGALVAARLAAEDAIGVRHGCFYARPYLTRLLGLSPAEARAARERARTGDRSAMPGAVRASAGINTSDRDVARLLGAVARLAAGEPPVRCPARGTAVPGSRLPRRRLSGHHLG